MEELKSLWEDGKLKFYGSSEKYQNRYEFKSLIDTCYSKEWIPHCKKTFNSAQSIIKYLGKYTHRIAISNYRIIRINGENVTFSVKDYRNEGKWKQQIQNSEGEEELKHKVKSLEEFVNMKAFNPDAKIGKYQTASAIIGKFLMQL